MQLRSSGSLSLICPYASENPDDSFPADGLVYGTIQACGSWKSRDIHSSESLFSESPCFSLIFCQNSQSKVKFISEWMEVSKELHFFGRSRY